MDVIVVEDSVAQALLIERQLAALGHKVRSARSGGKAVELLKERLPDLLVTDGILPELSGEALTRLVRTQDDHRYVYVLFVSSGDAMKVAFAAGADDFMAKPLEREELIARLRVADRISHLETRLRGRVRELESALRRLEAGATMAGGAISARGQAAPLPTSVADDELVPRELAEKPAFRRLEPTTRRVLQEFLHKDLAPAAQPSDFAPVLARGIALTSASLGVELRFVLSMESAAAIEAASSLFGPDPDPALVEDMLAELSNLVMGAAKAGLAEDGLALTSGIPGSVRLPLAAPSALSLARREHFYAAPGGIRIALQTEVSRCPTRRVRSFELSEGMVLATAVTNGTGVLLVPAGTRLTTTTIDRIGRTLRDETFEVLVASP